MNVDLAAPTDEETWPGITCEWLCEGRVLAYSIKTMAWESISRAFNHLISQVNAWPDELPTLLLLDLTDPQLVFTPRIRREVDAATRLISEREGRIAIVLRESILLQLAKVYIKLRPFRKMKQRILFDRQAAVAWLAEGINAYTAKR